jgi:uncharacterized damage-inducible protein DinB
MDATTTSSTNSAASFISAEDLLDHWQGHRRLTRRVIEAFPEDKLFTYSIGGMRPFSGFVLEFLNMAVPIARGVATGTWGKWGEGDPPKTKADLLARWDAATEELNRIWPTITPDRFKEEHNAFGQWKGKGHWQILYAIDNEIHHRAQGYVYLRSLGIEPPAFYDRS